MVIKMVLVDITLQSVIYIVISAATIATPVVVFWNKIVENIGMNIFTNMDFSKIPDTSPLKIQYNNIQKLLEMQESSYWERQEIRAELIRSTIESGIKLKADKDQILRDYDRYKAIPTRDGSPRNGHLAWQVSCYTNSDKPGTTCYDEANLHEKR